MIFLRKGLALKMRFILKHSTADILINVFRQNKIKLETAVFEAQTNCFSFYNWEQYCSISKCIAKMGAYWDKCLVVPGIETLDKSLSKDDVDLSRRRTSDEWFGEYPFLLW